MTTSPSVRPVTLLALVLALWAYVGPAAAQCPSLVWSDEFSGTSLDETRWEPMIGDGCDIGLCGWGNGELQWYKAENATVSGGTLKITAKKERVRSRQYTSARLRTANRGGEWTNGRFAARIRLPAGAGLWPAFWLLPTDPAVGWPMSGEIDVMESRGQGPQVVGGTIHFGDPWPENRFTGRSYLNRFGPWSDGFHVYAVEWEPGEMRWYVDDVLYSRKTPADLRGRPWPFEDYAYHLLLNLAVGGTFGATVDDSIFPVTMEVDWARVWNGRAPTLEGPYAVQEHQAGAVYRVGGGAGGAASYAWSVPAGATLVSGQGTASLTVDWGDASSSGDVVLALSDGCGSTTLRAPVFVEPLQVRDFAFDDFESERRLTLVTTTGTLVAGAPNPAPDAVNPSSQVARYTRNGAEQYDVIVYSTVDVSDMSPYIAGVRSFYLDVLTDAPVGTPITLQLEDSSATGQGFPFGRHSAFVGETRVRNAWQRIELALDARIDAGVADSAVDQIVLLFDSGWKSSNVYHFDNLASYVEAATLPTSLRVAAVTTGTENAGKGKKRGTATVTILDDLGGPVAGAFVSGLFSGTFSEVASGTTAADGRVTLKTAATAGGGVTVEFCVDTVDHALPLDRAASTGLCP